MKSLPGTAADTPLCFTCGTKMRPAGSCYVCEGCGSTSGCTDVVECLSNLRATNLLRLRTGLGSRAGRSHAIGFVRRMCQLRRLAIPSGVTAFVSL